VFDLPCGLVSASAGCGSPEEAKQAAADLLSNSRPAPLVTAVVWNAGADFSCASFRLHIVLAGEQHADDLFHVGDFPTSAFMAKPLVLSRCGVEILAAPAKLRITTATNDGTRGLGHGRAPGARTLDDLDRRSDTRQLNYRCRCFHGEHPLCAGLRIRRRAAASLSKTASEFQQ